MKLELILANRKTKKEKLHISISKIIAARGIFFTSRHLISTYVDAIAINPYCGVIHILRQHPYQG